MRRPAWLLAVVVALTAARSFCAPIDYAMGPWLTGYHVGFIKRGLHGALVAPLLAWKSPTEIAFIIQTLSFAELVLLFAAVVATLSALVRVVTDRSAQWALMALAVVIVSSPWVVMAARLDGYTDHDVELLMLACVWVAPTRARFLVPILTVAAVLVHELALVYGLPVLVIALALSGWRRTVLVVPAIVAAAITLTFFLPGDAQVDALRDHVRSYGVLGSEPPRRPSPRSD